MTSFSLSLSPHHLALPIILYSPQCSMPQFSLALRVFSHLLPSPHLKGENGGEKDKKKRGGTFTVLKVPGHGPLVL